MKGSKGYRSRTRRLLKKGPRERGKMKLSKLLYEYEPKSRVVVKIDPSVQKGMPHRRYHGKVGTVIAKRGRSYIISVTQGDSTKEILARPEHLEPYKSD
ncbi:MAG: 50S ribosomal protein L21e [Candidatus Bathyarchaeota archaeon]|nr:50S ribosomal protein L21e [Candidatus Bathyarchaeota archaeon]MDH5787852.1 50S ribosomal protein L21e [Candidatus Bathyarchaeota archaeon]